MATMNWTYTGDPGSSAKDLTRFLIGDTDESEPLLTDGEIKWVLSQYNNTPMNAAIRCCEAVIAKFSRLANESVGQVRIDFQQKAVAYRELQRDLRNRLATEGAVPFAGGISKSQIRQENANTDRVKPAFTEHMMENEQISPWVANNSGGVLNGRGSC